MWNKASEATKHTTTLNIYSAAHTVMKF